MTRLATAINCYLERYNIPKRIAAMQMDLHHSTFNRFLQGVESVSPETHAKIANWLLQEHSK